MSAQEQLREQVDLKIKTAIERLADATETEMARMYRRLEADITNRLDGFSRELATFSSALTKLNRQVEVITVEMRQNRDRQVQIQKRFGIGLTESSEPMPESSSRVVSEMNKLHEVVQSDLKNSKRINELNDVARKVMSRLDSVEEWLKENLTPEILRLKESIKIEQTLREEHDKEIMQLVGQYTDIMRRHFESAALDDHAPARSSSDQDEGNDELVSAPLPVNRLAGRRKLIRKLIEN